MRDWQPWLGLPLWVWLFVLPSALALACAFAPRPMAEVLRPLWQVLDRLYLAAGVVAAVGMVTILGLIVAQMIARWAGITFSGSTNYAGYAMAATSFFALAHALTRGAHIRVGILLNVPSPRFVFGLDAAATWLGALTATYFARYAVKATILSEMLNDRTQGQDFVPEWVVALFSLDLAGVREAEGWVYTPIWIPQLAMSAGAILLAVCLWDMLTRLLATRRTAIRGEVVE